MNAAIVAAYPGVTGAQLYFDFIAICGLIGAAAASFCVEKKGTQEHHFTLAELSARMEKTFGQAGAKTL